MLVGIDCIPLSLSVTGDLVNPHKELNIKKDYVNMNIVETEKLAWMKDIPKIELKKVSVLIYIRAVSGVIGEWVSGGSYEIRQ